MITSDTREWVSFLTNRWLALTELAAIERVYKVMVEQAQKHGELPPSQPVTLLIQPCRQIDIIKRYIIEALPQASFIDYTFEAQAPLKPDDFAEIYMREQLQCVEKVRRLMDKMHIS